MTKEIKSEPLSETAIFSVNLQVVKNQGHRERVAIGPLTRRVNCCKVSNSLTCAIVLLLPLEGLSLR